jgi:hypothetical protein
MSLLLIREDVSIRSANLTHVTLFKTYVIQSTSIYLNNGSVCKQF